MSFKHYLPLFLLALLVSCSHDFNNPLDPLNAGDNKAPDARFTMTPVPGIVGQDVTFDATPTYDPDNDNKDLEARWDFNRDGMWERDWDTWQAHSTVVHKFSNAGSYMVVLEVRDPLQQVGRKEKTLEIQDGGTTSPPFAQFVVNPATGDLNTNFGFDANKSKNSAGTTSDLTYQWRFDDGQPWSGWDPNPTANFNYHNATLGAGLKTITLQVRDTGTGQTAEARIQMEVTALSFTRSNPTAMFSVSPPRGNTSTSFNVDAGSCRDREDAITELQVQWDFGDGKGWSGWAHNKVNQVTYTNPGVKTIILQVKDTDTVPSISTASLQVFVE